MAMPLRDSQVVPGTNYVSVPNTDKYTIGSLHSEGLGDLGWLRYPENELSFISPCRSLSPGPQSLATANAMRGAKPNNRRARGTYLPGPMMTPVSPTWYQHSSMSTQNLLPTWETNCWRMHGSLERGELCRCGCRAGTPPPSVPSDRLSTKFAMPLIPQLDGLSEFLEPEGANGIYSLHSDVEIFKNPPSFKGPPSSLGSLQPLDWSNGTPFAVGSPASEASINTVDSGYLSMLSTPSSSSSIGTPDANAVASPALDVAIPEHPNYTLPVITPKRWPRIPRRRGRKSNLAFEKDTTNAQYLSPGGDITNSVSHDLVHCMSPMSKSGHDYMMDIELERLETCTEPVIPSIEESAQEATRTTSFSTVDTILSTHEEAPSPEDSCVEKDEGDSSSREPTPWPESWYEGGIDLGFAQFTARVMAESSGSVHGDIEVNKMPQKEAYDTATVSACTEEPEHGVTQRETGRGALQESQTQSSSSQTAKKRSRDDRDGDGDDDQNSPNRKRPVLMGPPNEGASVGPFYACPYQKRYPMESPFCGMPHGSRRVHGWTTISRVKQHLLESHGRDHHCSNCWKAYKRVDDAKGCHQKRNCLKRSSPPKLWLSESDVSNLRAEKFPGRSDDAWYRMFGLLFQDKEEYGPEGYRAKYTPYYSRVEYQLPSQFPTFHNGMSPNSIWTPSSNSTNSTGLTPPDTNGNSVPQNGHETREDTQPEHTTFSQMLQQDGTLPFDFDNLFEASTSQISGPEVPIASHMNNVEEQLETISSYLHSTHGSALNDATRASTASVPEPSCSCTSQRLCASCRLKKRITDLRTENEALRTTLGSLRRTLDSQDELLQDIDDGKLLLDDTMAKLWGYQDKMRKGISLAI